MLLYALGASGFILLAVVVAAFAFTGGGNGGGSQEAVAALERAGCTYRHPAAQGRTHVTALPKGFKANSVPRSSGPHSPQTIIYGAYSDEVPELNAVHNLEHGAVIIYYGPRVPRSTIDEIVSFYNDDPDGLIVSKHSRLGDDVAYVAWTHVARCPRFDRDLARQFIDAFGFNGPESCKNDLEQGCYRKENMKPGNG